MSQSQGDIQERIAAARREAETLKEKIRARREASADTSCKCALFAPFSQANSPSSACNGRRGRCSPTDRDAPKTCAEGPPGKDLCYALGR
jgi:hypothetical protein